MDEGEIEKRLSRELGEIVAQIEKLNNGQNVEADSLAGWIDSEEPPKIVERIFPESKQDSAARKLDWIKKLAVYSLRRRILKNFSLK